ncbi:MAG TPA: DUF1269 domain-containing protein [Thermomicrobiales bacterium]|nr:DUF1269 domain-containing protein [Thermomicrobiales bacterium]
MALMLALIYDTPDTADRAFTVVESLESARYVTILDRALLTKEKNGSVELEKEEHPVRHGATAGAVLGGMLGLIFLAPAAGAAAGAAVGAVVGRNADSGHREFKSFVNNVKTEIPKGGSAIVLLGDTDAPDRVIHDLGSFGGRLLSYDLSDDQLAALQQEVDTVAKQSGHREA